MIIRDEGFLQWQNVNGNWRVSIIKTQKENKNYMSDGDRGDSCVQQVGAAELHQCLVATAENRVSTAVIPALKGHCVRKGLFSKVHFLHAHCLYETLNTMVIYLDGRI